MKHWWKLLVLIIMITYKQLLTSEFQHIYIFDDYKRWRSVSDSSLAEQNSARERSLFLARPHGTLSLLTSVTKFAQLPSRRNWKLYFSLAFDCIWHRFYVTVVMHLRSYSSGGTTKFLTWTWTWTLVTSYLPSVEEFTTFMVHVIGV